MRFKSIQTLIFSILTLVCAALCIFVLCLPMGIGSIASPLEVSQKIEVRTPADSHNPVLSGKIKNKGKSAVTLDEDCFAVSVRTPNHGELYLRVKSSESITVEAGQEFDLSSDLLQFDEYDFLNLLNSWYDYPVTGFSVFLSDASEDTPLVLYDVGVIQEGQIYAVLTGVLAVVFLLAASVPLVVYFRAKRRYNVVKALLVEMPSAIYVLGGLCQKKSLEIKPTLFSRLKAQCNYLPLGVKINTPYASVEAMGFIVTDIGFYVIPTRSYPTKLSELEFFDKDDLDKSRINIYGKCVALNPLFNDNYFVFDTGFCASTGDEIAKLLSKMFDESGNVQNVSFDENSAQKNI